MLESTRKQEENLIDADKMTRVGDVRIWLLQPSLPEQSFKKHWQVLMVLRSLIVQAGLLLARQQLP